MDRDGNRTEITVDFLNHVHGVTDRELERGLDIIPIEDDFQPRLLTPVLCMKSRYHNLHSLPYGPDRITREVVRARLATNATRYYLLDLLENPTCMPMIYRLFLKPFCQRRPLGGRSK